VDHGKGDDIKPGCYVLDIAIKGIQFKKIWIRAEYLEIYDYFEDYYNEADRIARCPGGVLTGQPGIG
jgi:hypothetical protein